MERRAALVPSLICILRFAFTSPFASNVSREFGDIIPISLPWTLRKCVLCSEFLSEFQIDKLTEEFLEIFIVRKLTKIVLLSRRPSHPQASQSFFLCRVYLQCPLDSIQSLYLRFVENRLSRFRHSKICVFLCISAR